MGSDVIPRVRVWGSLVKFSHSVFALPFAMGMLVVAAHRAPVTIAKLLLMLVAIVSARTAAMAWNRLIDRHIDAANPRTAVRELPRGEVSATSVWQLVFISSIVFLWASWMLGWHCFVLAPIVLLVLLGYSLTKRFTPYSHLVLGLCLSAAPGGVWYATVGTIELTPLILMSAVLCWTAGFDILYSLQDEQFDRGAGLFSIPSKFGIGRAYLISAALHVACLVLLVWFGLFVGLGALYFVCLGGFGALLVRQQVIARRSIAEIDPQFFANNGYASVIFLIATLLG